MSREPAAVTPFNPQQAHKKTFGLPYTRSHSESRLDTACRRQAISHLDCGHTWSV